MSDAQLNVLVVDDSALARRLIVGSLEAAGMNAQCVADPLFALHRLKAWSPDVIVLDLEMPRMDGLTFLRVLKRDNHNIPVVICSGVAGQRSVVAMHALREGAVEVVARPRVGLEQFFRESQVLLLDAIVAAAQTGRRTRRRRPTRQSARNATSTPAPPSLPRPPTRVRRMPKLIALGASTGGTDALHQVIAAFPRDAPPTVIVQHMPEGFTAGFASWLNDSCKVRVKEAKDGDRLAEGTVLVARGGHHLRVRRDTQGFYAEVTTGPLIARHRPSVDALFESVAESVGADALGVLLTGMGTDGRDGMLALQNAGAMTIAQDEATSVVFGMPKAAIDAGAANEVLPIHHIAHMIFQPGLTRAG